MKHLYAMLAALVISTPVLAQSLVAEAAGQVKSIDAKSGKVTLHHGPIASLGWPAMTMTFQASPELLKNVKVGQNVKFTLQTPGNEITAIQAQ